MTSNSGVQATGGVSSEGQGLQAGPREPATDSEKYMAALWSELIGRAGITVDDKFLDVGGNSLTLNIILNRIEKETGASLEPQLFFDDERSSVFELARELDALRHTEPLR